ncbi:MAG: WhiB family transcriptional regulator [Dehalococcoidia bacterium]
MIHPVRASDELARREAWRVHARCRGLSPSLFFPPEEDGENVEDAKQICSECFVRDQCLASALEANEAFGVWGGTTPRERRRIKRSRKRSA